jgi:uncharacterized protein DUF6998
MTKEKHSTIKEIVFELIRKTQGKVIYQSLEQKVLEYFPDSKFKQSHWSWYRNQCIEGRYAHEFSKIVKDNLRRLSHSKKENHSPIEIDKKVIDAVHDVIKSALAYEKVTDNARRIGITGEVGEILACYHLGLRLCIDPRSAGFDAIDNKGKKVQIKTRRSETEGLPENAGRLGTFSKHPFDYALLVLLDREYQVAEIWKAKYKSVMPLIEKQKRRNPNLSEFKKLSQRIFRNIIK